MINVGRIAHIAVVSHLLLLLLLMRAYECASECVFWYELLFCYYFLFISFYFNIQIAVCC